MTDLFEPTLPEYVRCRTVGHAWDTTNPDRVPAVGVLMALRCVSCGMTREDTLDPHSGELLSRSYRKPEGYSGLAKQSRSEWRVSFLGLPSTPSAAAAKTVNGRKRASRG